jgi:hypothetical protein
VAEGNHLQLKRGNAADIPTLLAGELGLAVDTGALYSSKAGAGNIIVGGEGVLRDTAAGITLVYDLHLHGAPTEDTEAATKLYVDQMALGLDYKQSVRLATVTALTLATGACNGQTIDGETVVTGDRILIKNQADPIENGIYVAKASGAPDRATDMATAAELSTGAFCFVEVGTLHHTGWVMSNEGSVTIGTDAVTFVQFNAGSAYTGSLGVELVGNDIRMDIKANTGLELSGNEVGIHIDSGHPNLSVGADGLKIAVASAQYKFLMSGASPFDYEEASVSDLAGAGLDCTNGVLAVGEGTLLDVQANTVGIHAGASDYQFIGTGTTPWTASYKNISTLAGTGLVHAAGALSVGDLDFGAFV